ncbi:very long chain fatty acid elongase 7 [Halyomorpha halys]|uniref:very long chain fatty acid elongase 7 n=1 Tax=Halyomorpha halys TaxID=286706 RepID=UPI0006D4D43E|nr:elongation of very long chain fatty acids protein 7 [Halyomorpha halys]
MAAMGPEWLTAAQNFSMYEPGIEELIPPVFRTYHHIPVLLAAYLAIVKHYGPNFMRDRKPYNLKRVRMVYNVVQIIINWYICSMCFGLVGNRISDPWRNGCYPVTSVTKDPDAYKMIVKISYYYYVNKILDFIETVFFVLRKKQSQVSFLHLYHHVIMVISIWLSIFIIREENIVQIAAINTLVHVVMYVYYFLSGLGPGIQKYLWWKKYITRMQLIQFLMGMTTLVKMSVAGCRNDTRFLYLWYFNSLTLFSLFVHFYVKTYRKKSN